MSDEKKSKKKSKDVQAEGKQHNSSEGAAVQRNRDVEDRRSSTRPVRPGSSGSRGASLPRGGSR
ncbi:MAG TPA: hypothetical protein VM865_01200 [Acidobacteriaceae bacterium]|jgi:hypothetical protein|nr:hypothetical protein [Acidobacteriaceae bacterium]